MEMTIKEQKEHFIKYYGGRLPVHDYDYFKQRFNEIINSVKVECAEDIEKIRMITYATFGEPNPNKSKSQTRQDFRVEELENKIKSIDKIIYPKYYNLDNSESQSN